MVPSHAWHRGSRLLTEGRRPERDFHEETSGLRTVSSTTSHIVFGCSGSMCTQPAALPLDVALTTHPTVVCERPSVLHQVSEEDVDEAAVAEDVPDPAGCHGTGADVFARQHLGPSAVSGAVCSLATRRRRQHECVQTEHLTSSAERAR